MSQRANRHQRRPSQSVFVFPDNLSAPFSDNDGGDKVAPPSQVQLPPKENGVVPIPPPAKSSESEEVAKDIDNERELVAATEK
ncbi:unnamed protein product, partial [Ilex paraguariensis]